MLTCTKTIANNPNFKLGTLEQNRVVSSYGKLIGNASSDVETIISCKDFKQYNDNFSTWVDNLSAGNVIYDIMQGVDYDIQSYLYDTRKAPKDTVWYQKLIAILMN